MSISDLIPEFNWLAKTHNAEEAWIGPPPALTNLPIWMNQLAAADRQYLVRATYAAAQTACIHWEQWFAKSPEFALESISNSRPPTEQLVAVSNWLACPTQENLFSAKQTVDRTKQLHWYDFEYQDIWFSEPGMWAAESAEHCVMALVGVPYDPLPTANLATLSISCAINAFRTSLTGDIQGPLRLVWQAISDQLAKA